MAWIFSSRQSTVSTLIEVEEDEDSVELPVATPYCVGPCTCGKNCHFNVDYHDKVTRFDPDALVDEDLYERAVTTLGGG